jgi:hypothetical protein
LLLAQNVVALMACITLLPESSMLPPLNCFPIASNVSFSFSYSVSFSFAFFFAFDFSFAFYS